MQAKHQYFIRYIELFGLIFIPVPVCLDENMEILVKLKPPFSWCQILSICLSDGDKCPYWYFYIKFILFIC